MKSFFLIGAIFILTILFAGCSVYPVRVEGTAMKPNFNDGDRLLVDKDTRQLSRGDVITFLYPKNRSKQYLKRIIGLPGERVEIREGKVFIDGKLLEETYLDQSFNQTGANLPELLIPENHFFVLGDNRDNSSDSRAWGTLPRELIVAKYYLRYAKAE